MVERKFKWIILLGLVCTLVFFTINAFADTKAPETFAGVFDVFVYNSDGNCPQGPTTTGMENGLHFITWLKQLSTGDTSRIENEGVPGDGFDYNVIDYGGGVFYGSIGIDLDNYKMWNEAGEFWDIYSYTAGDSIFLIIQDVDGEFEGEYLGFPNPEPVAPTCIEPLVYVFTGPWTEYLYYEVTLCSLSVGINVVDNKLPKVYFMNQNHPNPFNATTVIEYGLPEAADVQISICNILGEQVKVLANETQQAGYKRLMWDGTDDSNKQVSTGVYFYSIRANNFEARKRMVLIK